MYKDYFGLIDEPFSIAPNPQYLYMSERHREALAHLLYGVTMEGGFILLTGEVGTGKTTVCRCLLEQIPDDADVAFILNPKMTSHELLAAICDELEIKYSEHASIKALIDALNVHLLNSHARSRKTVLIIDEAQNLSIDVLEQLRLLTNLETNQRKLIQVILLGQPELNSMLARDELRQLSQRVTARFHLQPLNKAEVANYIHHRLAVAGARGTLFPYKVIRKIFRKSGGIPRLINLLCDRALLGTYAQNRLAVDSKTIDQAAKEIFGSTSTSRLSNSAILASLILVSSGAIAWSISQLQDDEPEPGMVLPAQVEAFQPGSAAAPSEQRRSEVLSEAPYEDMSTEPEFSAALVLPSADTSQVPLEDSTATLERDFTTIDSLDNILQLPKTLNFDLAFEGLLASWSVDIELDPDVAPCSQVIEHNMRCLSRIGSLRELSHINRPAILTFLYNDGQYRYAIVSKVKEDKIMLQVTGSNYYIAPDDLINYWTGNYLLVWRTPPDHRVSILPGDSGADIIWLDAQLSEILNYPPRIPEDLVFDAILQEQVRIFQLSSGLVPDGIVGPKTWIQINNRVRQDVPMILDESE
jgi:general secretion pathway protein A